MKNKPEKHKTTNRFKFQSFADRIGNIDVRRTALYHLDHTNIEEPEENETYFFQAIQKWNVLNLTEDFCSFRKSVGGIITLPQLIHKKDEVVQSLLTHLKQANNLSLQPLLELIVVLAKDLREDFYPYFQVFLEQLISLLGTKDTEILEWTLICLAYLFKTLRTFLKKDVSTVFSLVLPLLAESRPTYINNFAAESFAFIARDIKDKKKFLILILKSLKGHRDGIAGCGRLLFEMMRGVNGTFHSCTNTFLPFLIDSLSDDKLPQKLLYEVLVQTVTDILSCVHFSKSEIFWKTMFENIDSHVKKFNPENDTKGLEFVLKLIGQAVEHKQGKFLIQPVELTNRIISITNTDFPESVCEIVSQISVLLLISNNISLPQENASRITMNMLSTKYPNLLLDFVQNVVKYTQFELLILPQFLKYCTQTELDDKCLKILTQICLQKAPLCKNGLELDKWRKYQINLKSEEVIKKLYGIIDIKNIDEIYENIDNFLCALICLPHIDHGDIGNTKIACKTILKIISDELKPKSDAMEVDDEIVNSISDIKKNLFILGMTLETAVHIDSDNVKDYLDVNELVDVLLPFSNSVDYLQSLNVLDLALTASSIDLNNVDINMFNKLYDVLAKNFSAPCHQVRLITTHIFCLFNYLPEFNNTNLETEQPSLFTILNTVENITPSVHQYREQLQYLQKLNFENAIITNLNEIKYKQIPLRYCLGVLYMNFKLLWDPIMEIIESYATGLTPADFWNVFLEELENSVKNSITVNEKRNDVLWNSKYMFINDIFESVYQIDDKADFVNYRILLWKCMTHFTDLCEAKNRNITELFLNFMRDEFKKVSSDTANTWNVKETNMKTNGSDENTMVVDNLENENGEEVPEEKQMEAIENLGKTLTEEKSNISVKSLHKLLLAHLAIFSSVRSPKTMYREPELYKIYLDLLSSKNSEIQKSALDCIMTYKHKYLVPYKQNLYNLIDDKKFKDELTTFRVDVDTEMIEKMHRENFIPIVLRIVYSKMITKVGTNTKGGGQLRRSLVLRFIAGCSENELIFFVNMAFKSFSDFMNDDILDMTNSIIKNTNLENVMAPKRLLSSINLLGVVREQFGGLMSNNFIKHLIKMVLCIGAIVNGVLTQDNVHSGYMSIMKNLRNLCIQALCKFFSQFDSYPWMQNEIDAIFNVFIWPWLDKLSFEGIHSPTALLKLFVVWSQNPRYYILLAKHHADDKSLTPLVPIVKLLLNSKTKPHVSSAILEMFEKMLTLQMDEEELTKTPPILIENTVDIDSEKLKVLSLSEKLNFGSCLLLPYIPDILERIKRKVLSSSSNKAIGRKELLILSRATELVWDSETSNTLLRLMLPILVKRASGNVAEEILMQLMVTLKNLVQKVDDPENHIRAIAPLFNEINAMAPRKLLCDLIKIICERKPEIKIYAEVMIELNAWDAKWIEQPDFDRRLNAYKNIENLLEKNAIDLELGVLIIYNNFYFMRLEKDLALRETASLDLKKIIPVLAVKYQNVSKEREFLMSATVLHMIRNCFRDKNETIRNEGISLLGELVRECPEVHPVLKDLAPLANKADQEVDFFENLQHLQTHRKVRALLKFCSIAKTLPKAPQPRTLTQFILPLASIYLCNEKFTGKNTMIDASIEVISTVCKLLPWHQYETILKYYLGKLRHNVEFQKQLVRLVVAILDAFHFDLSKAQDVKLVEPMEEADKTEVKVEDKKTEETQDKSEDQDEKSEEDDGAKIESDLDEVLDDANDSEDLEEVQLDENFKSAIDRLYVLPQSAAKRLIHTITTGLLPQLNHSIAQMTAHEGSHKLNRRRTGAEREEEEVLRVPIALALVKLLQKLPKQMLDRNLAGIVIKICTFLKSPLKEVRLVTRDVLKKIMIALGPQYMDTVLEQLRTLMTRGFQVHVLIATVHDILEVLKNEFKEGDMDRNLQSVLEVCKEDLFGQVSEEKTVEKLGVKTPEAKASRKSFITLQIIAQCITDKCLLDLLMPFKEVLTTSHSKKTILKTQECLGKIVQGLVDNKFMPLESLLIFLYGTSSESIPELQAAPKKQLTESQRELMKRAKPDCFLIPEAPRGRSGAIRKVVKTNSQTNAHVMIEFGLGLLHTLLKQEKLRGHDFRPFLDPLIPILNEGIKSTHVRVTTLSLKCICSIWTTKMIIPNMQQHVKEIAEVIFNILHKFATAGLSKNDENFPLVKNAFKTMNALVRHVKYFTIDKDQLKILLLYVEQDLYDYDRQASAFTLLKSIISAKLVVPEMHEVIDKVCKLSIVAELPKVREESRVVIQGFLMDYPLGKKIEKYLQFFITQLNYELDSGRESAIRLLHYVVQKFPEDLLTEHSGLFFLSLGARLVNDPSSNCRKSIADCLETMLERLSQNDRDNLFEIILVLFKDKKTSHREMSAQLCSRFVNVEKQSFQSRLAKLLPHIEKQLTNNSYETPGKFVLLVKQDEEENVQEDKNVADEKVRAMDHHLIQVLKMLLKICEHCPSFLKSSKYHAYVDEMASQAQKLLAYPHAWVRLEAAKLLENILSSLDNAEIHRNLVNQENNSTRGFLYYDTHESLKSLVLDMCAQMVPGDITAEFAEQIVKNLIYVVNIIKDLRILNVEFKNVKDESIESRKFTVNLHWLIRRMRYVVHAEIAKTPSEIVLRTSVFNWIEGVVTLLESDQLSMYGRQLLAPLIREMTSTDESNATLRQHSNRIGKRLKNKIGEEEFNRLRQLLTTQLSVKRADRKKVRAQEKINNPVKAAKRKLQLHEKKKVLKRKRMAEAKGKSNYKKSKTKINLEDYNLT